MENKEEITIDITICGVGRVGSQIAFGCILHPIIRSSLSELNLIDIDEKKLCGEIADLTQMKEMLPEGKNINITNNPISESDIFVIAAGATGNDREKLFELNSNIVREYLEKIQNVIKSNSVVIMVSNPTGRLAQIALDYVPLVIPTGFMLDNARLKLCKAVGKHEKPDIQAKYLEVKENKGCTCLAPATEALIRILQYQRGFFDTEI